MKKVLFILLGAGLLTMASCNKTKQNSRKFMKAGEWKITELSVAGQMEDELPHWEIEDCDIYESSCEGEWKNDEGGHAEFIWQFRENGEVFEISHQAEEHGHEHEHDHAAEEAAEQCYHFSGVYTVTEFGKDAISFSSSNTVGYPGETVILKIEKK